MVYGPEPVTLDTDGDLLPDWYERLYASGSPTGLVATADGDHDGADAYHEFRAGTNPTNAASVIGVTAVSNAQAGPVTVSWASGYGRQYRVNWTTNLANPFVSIASNIAATPPVNVFTHTNAPTVPVNFYRIGLE